MLRSNSPPFLTVALVAGLPLRLLPTGPLTWLLRQVARTALHRYPGVGERLARLCGRRLLLDPSDLPLAFVLELTDGIPEITVLVQGRDSGVAVDAAVRGAFADLLALVEGRADADALFFSRDLHFTGDTEMIVGLRNALDDARIDLRALLTEALSRFVPLTGRILDIVAHGYTRLDEDLALLTLAVNAPSQNRLEQQAAEIERLRQELEELRRHSRRSSVHSERGLTAT